MKTLTNAMTGTLTASDSLYTEPAIVSVDVTANRVEIVKRRSPKFTYTVYGPNSTPPDRVYKEVWEIEEGQLVRKEDVIGTHRPATTTPEGIFFP